MTEIQQQTTHEAVVSALREWSNDGSADDSAVDLALDLAISASEDWLERSALSAGPVAAAVDDGTIAQAVLSAMDDWKSSDHTADEMAVLIEEHVLRAGEDYQSSNPAGRVSP